MDAGSDIMQGEIKLDRLLKSKKKRCCFKPPITRAKRLKTVRNQEDLEHNAVKHEKEPSVNLTQENKRLRLKRKLNQTQNAVTEENAIENKEYNLKASVDTEILPNENSLNFISNKLIKTLDNTFFAEDENLKLCSSSIKSNTENSDTLESVKFSPSKQINNSKQLNEIKCSLKEIETMDELNTETSLILDNTEFKGNKFTSTKVIGKDEEKCTYEDESNNVTIIKSSQKTKKMNCILKEFQTMEETCIEINSTSNTVFNENILTKNGDINEEQCTHKKYETDNVNEKETIVLCPKENISNHLQNKDNTPDLYSNEIHTYNLSKNIGSQTENGYIDREHLSNLREDKTEGLDGETLRMNQINNDTNDIINNLLINTDKENYLKTNEADFQTLNIVNITCTDDCKVHSTQNATFDKKKHISNNRPTENENNLIKDPNLELQLPLKKVSEKTNMYSVKTMMNEVIENGKIMQGVNTNIRSSCFEEKDTNNYDILQKDMNWESEESIDNNESNMDQSDIKTSPKAIQIEMIEKELVTNSENSPQKEKNAEKVTIATDDTSPKSVNQQREKSNVSNATDAVNKNPQEKKKTLTLFYVSALDYVKEFKANEPHIFYEEKETMKGEPLKNENLEISKQDAHTKTSTSVKCDKQDIREDFCNLTRKQVRNIISSDKTNEEYAKTDNDDLSRANILNSLNIHDDEIEVNDTKKEDNRNVDILMYDAFSIKSLNNSQFEINVDKTMMKFDIKENNSESSNILTEGEERNMVPHNKKANSLEPSKILECANKQNKFPENSATKNEELKFQNRHFKDPEMTFLVTARDCFKTDAVMNESSSNENFSNCAENEATFKGNDSGENIKDKDPLPFNDAEDDFEMDDNFTLTASQLSMIETDEKNQIKSLTEEKIISCQQTASCSNTHFGFDSITVEVINQLSYIRDSMESIKEILEKALKKY